MVRDLVRLPDGAVATREYVRHPGAVCVVPVLDDGRLVMVRQYRHGIQRTILELPGGAMEAVDADPLATAQRELQEETGYTSSKFIKVGQACPNPANQSNAVHFFLALEAGLVSEQHLDEAEEIEVELVPLEELVRMAKAGELVQSMQVSAVFFTLAYLDRIK